MGKSSGRSDVVVASQIVNSGESNKRVAEEVIKLNLKKNKFDEVHEVSTNRYWSIKGHSIAGSSSDFRTEINIGSAAPAKKKDEFDEFDEPLKSTGASKTLKSTRASKTRKSTGASKTLIVEGLSYSTDESQVINFFKQVGDIVDVCLYYCYDEEGKSRADSCHIEFATEEAAKKAANLHDEFLLGHRIKLFHQASKTLLMEDLPFYTLRSDVFKFFTQVGEVVDVRFCYAKDGKFRGTGHIEFATEEAAEKAERLSGLELVGSQVELRRKARGTGASKTLCLKNLPFHIMKSDVINFFENVGDIADVRFSCDESKTTLRRVAHVEFATEEAALEAVQWNDRELLGCPVRLGIVRETLCVQGLDTSLGIDKVRSFLKKHFQTCESIVHVEVPEYHYTGVPLGCALIEFSSLQAFHRALDLDGQEVDGTSLTITDYVPKYLSVRGTGPREVTREGFGNYCGAGYEKVFLYTRSYRGAGLGKDGSSRYPPAGNKIRFESD